MRETRQRAEGMRVRCHVRRDSSLYAVLEGVPAARRGAEIVRLAEAGLQGGGLTEAVRALADAVRGLRAATSPPAEAAPVTTTAAKTKQALLGWAADG